MLIEIEVGTKRVNTATAVIAGIQVEIAEMVVDLRVEAALYLDLALEVEVERGAAVAIVIGIGVAVKREDVEIIVEVGKKLNLKLVIKGEEIREPSDFKNLYTLFLVCSLIGQRGLYYVE